MLVPPDDQEFWINYQTVPVSLSEPNKWASTEKTERLRLNLARRCRCIWTGLALAAPIGKQPRPTRGTARYPRRAKSLLSLCGRVRSHPWLDGRSASGEETLGPLAVKSQTSTGEFRSPPKRVQHLYAVAQEPLAGTYVNWQPISGDKARYVINHHHAQYEASLDPTACVSSSEQCPCLEPVA